MQLAEIADRLRAERNRAGPSRVVPGRRPWLHGGSDRLPRGRIEDAHDVRFCGERVGRGRSQPMARRVARANPRGDRRLRAGHPGFELRPDLEKHSIRMAPRLIARRGGQDRGKKRGAQRIQISRDGIGQLAGLIAASEEKCVLSRDERKMHRLVEAPGRERAPRHIQPPLRRRENGLRYRIWALHRLRMDFVEPVDTHDFFDEVGRAVHVRAPGGRHDAQGVRAGNGESQFRQDTNDLGLRQDEAR